MAPQLSTLASQPMVGHGRLTTGGSSSLAFVHAGGATRVAAARRPRVGMRSSEDDGSVTYDVVLPSARAVARLPYRAALFCAGVLGLRKQRERKPRRVGGAAAAVVGKRAKKVEMQNELANLWEEGLDNTLRACASLADSVLSLLPGALPRAALAGLPAMSPEPIAPADDGENAPRSFLKPGSYFQNPYMSLWNDANAPVSSVLTITSWDHFELRVSNMDSVNEGSEGWIVFRAAFEAVPVAGNPGRVRLVLHSSKQVEALSWSSDVFKRPANFMMGCMNRMSWVLMGAFCIEVDLETEAVICGSSEGMLRKFWETTVGLEATTSKDELWIWDEVDRHVAPGMPALAMA